MKKLIILFIVSTIGLNVVAQKTKKVTITNKNPRYKEIFYVFKSDKKVKHGSYQKFNYKDELYIQGYYQNGKKDSVWEFYNYKGDLEQKYDFEKNKVIFYKEEKKDINKECLVINNGDSIKSKLDQPPLYIGGTAIIFPFLADNLMYPSRAKANGISGKVYISFVIDSLGEVSNYQVAKKVHEILDNEALRVVKLLPINWSPALLDGKPVSVIYEMPINFILR